MFIFQSTQKYTSAEVHFCQNLVSNKYDVKIKKKKRKTGKKKNKTTPPPPPPNNTIPFLVLIYLIKYENTESLTNTLMLLTEIHKLQSMVQIVVE